MSSIPNGSNSIFLRHLDTNFVPKLQKGHICDIYENLDCVNLFAVKVHSHGAAAAMVPLSVGFQPHSEWQQQWQSNIQCNAKYFATATAAQNGVGTYLLAAPLPQVLV